VTFQQEFVLARVRQRGSKLWFAHLTLFAGVFVLAFMSGHVYEDWINFTAYSVVGLLLLVFWLIPTWRFATNFVDITTTRVVQRGGLFARTKREVANTAITSVDYSRGKGIVLSVADAEPLILSGLPKAKDLAEELRQTLAK
jgi:membrane protein YdbS with pleckstrin-like domain